MRTDATWLEQLWTVGHASGPGWALFQLAAVVAGGAIVWTTAPRQLARRLAGAFALGVVLAALGALALGSGEAWVRWLINGRAGTPPEIEIAGFGAIAGLIAGYGMLVRAPSRARALDVLAPALGAMLAIARLGCFFAGCDFGKPAALPWALRYPALTPAFRAQLDAGLIGASATQTLPVHPTQLYEVLVGVAVLAVMLAWRTAPRRDGDRFAVALLMYAAGRCLVDFVRGDLPHGEALGLTPTQGYALALAGLAIAWRAKARAQSWSRENVRSACAGAEDPGAVSAAEARRSAEAICEGSPKSAVTSDA